MSLALTNRIADEGTDSFTPADYLLCIVQRSMETQSVTRIYLHGQGEIVILPKQNIYYSNVPNMAEFCRTPANQFESEIFENIDTYQSVGIVKNIRDLLWQCAFHASQGRLIEGCSKYDVVQFRHWPNLTRLPVTPNAARICALLTRHPTTIMLIHRVLGIDKDEVYQIYSSAYCAGITHMISRSQILDVIEDSTDITPQDHIQGRGLFRSLFAKISGL